MPPTGLIATLAPFALALAGLLPAAPQEKVALRPRAMRLPFAENSLPVKDARKPAAELHLLWDGRIYAGERLLYDPEMEDWKPLRAWLVETAGKMKRKPLANAPSGNALPDGLLLIRADDAAPFKRVQQLLVECGASWVCIWRIHLATRCTKEGSVPVREGRLDISLPVIPHAEDGTADGAGAEPIELQVVVLEPGKRITRPGGKPWSEKEDEYHCFDPASRKLQYRIGPVKIDSLQQLTERFGKLAKDKRQGGTKRRVMIDPRVGAITGDVTAVMGVLLGAKFTRITFPVPD